MLYFIAIKKFETIAGFDSDYILLLLSLFYNLISIVPYIYQ